MNPLDGSSREKNSSAEPSTQRDRIASKKLCHRLAPSPGPLELQNVQDTSTASDPEAYADFDHLSGLSCDLLNLIRSPPPDL